MRLMKERSILLLCGMSDFKLRQKVAGLQDCEDVAEIRLVRRRTFSGPKVIAYAAPAFMAWSRWISDLYRIACVFWICMRRKPDVIVSFYLYYHGVIGWLAGRLFGISFVLCPIGTDMERAFHSAPALNILRAADAVVVNGEISKVRLVAAGLDAAKITHPTSAFSVDDCPVGDGKRIDYDLCFSGSLVPVKRIDLLLDILARITRDRPGTNLVILGNGPLRASLEQKARDLGLSENVSFAGSVPGREVPSYLVRSRLFVMTSRSEGLPMAMIEAICCGVPAVVPDVGDVRCVLRPGENGLLADPEDTEGTARLLLNTLNNDELQGALRRGAVATRDVLRHDYSRERVASVWQEVLSRISGSADDSDLDIKRGG